MTEPEFEELLEEHRPYVYALFLSRLGHEEAPDAVQEMFCRKWRARHSYNPELAQFKTWLNRNANNLCVEIWRKRPQHQELEIEIISLDFEETSNLLPDTSPAFAQQSDWKIAFESALEALTLEEKNVVFARAVDQYTLQETAILMGKTISEVRTIYDRGRLKLRNKLNEHGIEVDDD